MSLEKLFNGEVLSISEVRGPIAVLVSAARARGERHNQVLPKVKEVGERLINQVDDLRVQLLIEWWLMCTTDSRGIGLSHNADNNDYQLPTDIYELMRTLLENRHTPEDISIIDWFSNRMEIDRNILEFKRRLRVGKGGENTRSNDNRSWDEIVKEYIDLPSQFDTPGVIPVDPGWTEADFRKELNKLSTTGSIERKFRQAATQMAQAATHAIDLSKSLSPLTLGMHVGLVGSGQIDSLDPEFRDVAKILLADLLDGDYNFKNHASDELRRSAPSLKHDDVNLLVLLLADWLDSVSNEIPVISERYKEYRLLSREAIDKEKRGVDVTRLLALLESGDFNSARAENDHLNESGRQERAQEDQRARLTGFLRQIEESRDDANSGDGLWIDEIEEAANDLMKEIGYKTLELIREEIQVLETKFKTERSNAISQSALSDLLEIREFCEPDLYTYIDDLIARIENQGFELEEFVAIDDLHTAEIANLERRFQSTLVQLKSHRDSGFSDSYAELYSEWQILIGQAEDFDDEMDTQAAKKELLEKMRDLNNRIANSVIQVWNPKSPSDEVDLVQHITNFVCERAGFTESDVLRFHVALKSKRFVVLAGITGTGKSTLARFYAEALGSNIKNGQLVSIAVRPNWIDQSEVLGYVNPMTNRFHAGWLTSLMQKCHRNPKNLHICVLDEMNLAPVEQYMAEVLSAIEHFSDSGDDPMISLYPEDAQPSNADDWSSQIALPRNLFFIGTVNVDESTRALTDRVIDRGHMIQLNVTVSSNHHNQRNERLEPSWKVGTDAWNTICATDFDDSRHDDIIQLSGILQKMRIGVGIRTHIEIERYLMNALNVLAADEAFDFAVLQRLIPKIRGYRRDLEPGLLELKQWLRDMDAPRCERVVDYWLSDERDGDDFIEGTDPFLGVVTSDEE